MQVLIILFIVLTALAGWRLKLLTFSGAAAATAVGVCIYIGLGSIGLVTLGAFFASSSLFSRLKRNKKKMLDELLEKGDQRDAVQVFANGGIPAVISFIYLVTGDSSWIFVFCSAIAAANADTWASEIGTLSKGQPRMMLSLKKVERGTSGAVSLLGTLAAIAGAAFIAITGAVLFSFQPHLILLIIAAGFFGNMVDTVLGGTLQVAYTCPVCGKQTEKRMHCSAPGKRTKGSSFFDNDAVNAVSVLAASILAVFIQKLLTNY
ncbi:DUF92 domain-containing protein [Bacillus lacus]|uniref:DUF92 domain-containing protein n=1 Tax=Metabacillus lacus TaxID=1983721 RepID=A0A7X2IZF7_9BACI|nr:DUF92 domain-containing protein [Metabacillus lacus]MRX72632.1 DUF92 domain-containing protein [Metabacillus lacus]